MIHVISYDISDNRRRTKVAELLIREGYERSQFSVFIGRRHPQWKSKLWPKLQTIVQPGVEDGDRLFVLRLPAESLKKRETVGTFTADVDWLLGQRHTLLITGAKNAD